MSQHEEKFKKTLAAMGPDALRDQSKWGKPVEDPAEFVREMLSFEQFVEQDRWAWGRRMQDTLFVEQQNKLRQLTEEERCHWVETGEWPERLSEKHD
jgi:hypothetical protein